VVEPGADAGVASISISDEQAHSGRYSAKLSGAKTFVDGSYPTIGGGLYESGIFPEAAYYSAWYFVPAYDPNVSGWDIFRFCDDPSSADGGGGDPVDDGPVPVTFRLRLEALPGAGIGVMLIDVRAQYGSSPFPDLVPTIPISQWFQVECFLRSPAAGTGELAVWLNGVQIYDIVRPMPTVLQQSLCFSVCSLFQASAPASATLFVDDVAVTWIRATPQGMLKLSE
jgi:hypothetical protein